MFCHEPVKACQLHQRTIVRSHAAEFRQKSHDQRQQRARRLKRPDFLLKHLASHRGVVANHHKKIPIALGTMKRLNWGRPKSPTSIPNVGIQMLPIMASRIIVGSDQPGLLANSNHTSHRTKLTIGLDSPTKLARACHPELFAVFRYFTTPQSQMSAKLKPNIRTSSPRRSFMRK